MKARSGGAASFATFAMLAALGASEARAADPARAPSTTATATTASAAAVDGVTTPATPAIPSTAAAEAELPAQATSDSFTSEDATETDAQHRLDLYGFADMTYLRLLVPQSSVWNRFYFPTNSFAVGNFNLYMSSNLGDGWRALGEVRFMYLPNGSTTNDTTTGDIKRTDTTVLDYAGFEEPIHWGAIRIERIWVEHEFGTLLKVQVGQFLTPYGIWNVDHGTPAIIGIRAPVAVADELFPAHQTGIQLYGSKFFDPFEIGYHLTLSNGRGSVEYQDFNDDKAVGGRLYLKTEAFGSLTIGTAFYRGGYYDRDAKYVLTSNDGHAVVDQQLTTTSKYQEISLGADLKWQWKHLLVQGEAIVNEAKFSRGGRPRVQVVIPPQGFQADYRRWGAYGLVGYRTPWVQTMPYAMVQYVFAPDDPIVPPILGAQFGLNIRPTPAVVLKTEVTFTHFGSAGSTGLGLSPLRIWASQVAWAF